jgi:3'(2'),5'-bisphosphate nucleotidase
MTAARPPWQAGLAGQALAALCGVVEQAADEVMAVYRQADLGQQLKDDRSPVTQADLRADALIRRELERLFPDAEVVSEESLHGRTALPDGPHFLVDPLDGTREFIDRNGEFTVNIARIEGGCAVLGVVGLPVTGEVYAGGRGLGAWVWRAGSWTPLHAVAAPSGPGGALRVLHSRSHLDPALQRWLQALPLPLQCEAAGSSLKFCRIAEGRADLYPRFGPTSAWDTAAGQCVLEAAGGQVVDRTGRPLRYGPARALRNPDFFALGDAALCAGIGLPPMAA